MRSRLRGSGNGARWFAFGAIPILLYAFWLGQAMNPDHVPSDVDRVLLPIFCVLAGVGVYLLVRSLFVGVHLGTSDIRIRSWWVTRTIPAHALRTCQVIDYSGLLNQWMESQRLGVLRLHWVDEGGFLRVQTFRGTIQLRRAVRSQAVAIADFANLARDSSWPEFATLHPSGADG